MTDERGEALAWDRVGRFLQQTESTGTQIATRNRELWNSVADHLRKDEKYTADDMADDVARSMTTAMDNLDSVWSMLTTLPRQSQVAQPLPTAFLMFKWVGRRRHKLSDPVRIDVDRDVKGRTLPRRAKIAVHAAGGGQSAKGKAAKGKTRSSSDAVKRLKKCIVALRAKRSPAYVLETVNRDISRRGRKDTYKDLAPGLYDGLVYITDPPMALANIRILVEGDPSASRAFKG